jgi:hypothetical protein
MCPLRWSHDHFSVPVIITPIVQGNVIAQLIVDSPVIMAVTSIGCSPMTKIDEEEEPIF